MKVYDSNKTGAQIDAAVAKVEGTGGSTNQVLTKKADGTTGWEDAQGGGNATDIAYDTPHSQAGSGTVADALTQISQDLESVKEYVGYGTMYGIKHYYNEASPVLERTGNMTCHKTLPVQSLMRRCLVRDDGTVNYYLDANDSTKKADGSAAVLDGTDGQVMVEIPAHYRRCRVVEDERPYYEVMISLYPFAEALEIKKMYVSAYEATLDRTNNKLSSVVNTTAQYRGGSNNSEWDGTYLTLCGLPVSVLNLSGFRTAAANRGNGWYCYDWEAHNTIAWLYYIEYANLNVQLAVSNNLTDDGYHQGGLGNGISNLSDWNGYNGYNPCCPCGHTNSLGNKSGDKQLLLYNSDEEMSEGNAIQLDLYSCSYRGIENPFGHIWKWTDGFLSVGAGEKQVYYMCRTHNYSDSINDNYESVGISSGGGWVKNILMNTHGDLLPSIVGGGSDQYYCDYHWEDGSLGSVYGSLVGGAANYGAFGGLACVDSFFGPAFANAIIGSRLVGHFNS